ncbi:MAG: hypothetical protein ACFFDD_11550, partial [Promethearchaeota archaeon]
MESEIKNRSRICPVPPNLSKSRIWNQKPRIITISLSVVTMLFISALATSAPTPIFFEATNNDILLMDVDWNGNLVQNVIYNTNVQSDSVPFWGKITELANGGFAIAGFNETDNSGDRQLWVIRTDEDYNPLWNRTYGSTFEIRAITEMNNGDLAIGHYIEEYDDHNYKGLFQIIVIDDEGEFVREQSWPFGWLSGFSHCDDGGFILAKEIYFTVDCAPFWIARIDTELNVIWNKTYSHFASMTDIIEDMAGGFTMPYAPVSRGPIGIVRLDSHGNETSRIFTSSFSSAWYFWITQCSNGEYLGWYYDFIIRFNIEGEIIWEKNVDFCVHGIEELSPDRFVAFDTAGIREMGCCHPGVNLECFAANGTTLWSRSVQGPGFFVPDIIYNTDGCLTILGMVDSNYLSSVLDDIPEANTQIFGNLIA